LLETRRKLQLLDKPNQDKAVSNHKINKLLVKSNWAISREFALEYLNQYKLDIGLGAKVDDIKQRREAKKPTLISFNYGLAQEFGFTAEQIESKKNQIARIPIKGAMFTEDQLSSFGATTIAADIRRAAESANIDSIILDVNSGGGEVMAGVLIQNAVKGAASKKPVVAHVHNAGSAALMAILPSTEIVMSSELSRIGSIGVMARFNKLALEMESEFIEEVYSNLSPDKNEEFRALKEGDSSKLIASLDETAAIFQSQVKKMRPLRAELQESTLSGGFFKAKDGIKRGLADRMGTFQNALNRVNTLSRQRRKDNNTGRTYKAITNMSLLNLIGRLTGKHIETEAAAIEALESANLVDATQYNELKAEIGALTNIVRANGEAIQESETNYTNLAEAVTVISTNVDKLNTEIEAAASTAKEETEVVTETVNEELDAIKAQNAALIDEINALKASKSGVDVAGDGVDAVQATGEKINGEETIKFNFKITDTIANKNIRISHN